MEFKTRHLVWYAWFAYAGFGLLAVIMAMGGVEWAGMAAIIVMYTMFPLIIPAIFISVVWKTHDEKVEQRERERRELAYIRDSARW